MAKLDDPINHMLLQYEVAALKSLTTSNHVLKLYDVYATKNNTYLITELMEGDLHNLLKAKKQFGYYEACEIIQQIITGYYDVYKSGYLHRDIKPANIFYKKGVYKIGDFGFAIPTKDSH
jgi:serine/threonine protein kinase